MIKKKRSIIDSLFPEYPSGGAYMSNSDSLISSDIKFEEKSVDVIPGYAENPK